MFGDILYGLSWTCEKPKANIIILTGMQETAERYDGFANFLTFNDFDVYCIDHYGQGYNIDKNEIPGKFPHSGFSRTVKMCAELNTHLQRTGLPTYIFAHSMGSFMAQDYIQRFHNKTKKVVICGSDCVNSGLMSFAYGLAKFLVHNGNRDKPNRFLAKLVTGNFAKKIENRKTDFDWLSHNEKNVETYIKDPKCGFVATGGFYREFLKGMRRLPKKKYLKKINKDMSILIISGSEDPVGHMGKGPRKLSNIYKKLGIVDTRLILYPNMRHEILNENDNQKVYDDILKFFNN